MSQGSSSLGLRAVFAWAVALALAALAPGAGAGPMLVEQLHNTNADVHGSGFVGSSSDVDIAPGDGRANAYAEVAATQPLPFWWWASGVAGANILNTVGVDLTRPDCCVVGESNAFAVTEWLLENDTDQWLTGGMSGVYIPAGEILFMIGGHEPVAGGNGGFVDVSVVADGAGPIFHYRMELRTTNGDFEEVDGSTDNVLVDQVFRGDNGRWGYSLGAVDFDFPVPDVAPYGELRLTHYMQAYGFNHFHQGEEGAGLSVKLGDPLQPLSGHSLQLLPEPEALLLLGSSLALLAASRARGRA